jgi:NAD dependent epimerase/dehydratase family enzyme
MKLLITGGTGFIGTPLCRSLGQAGHELLVLTRTPGRFTPQPHRRFLAWEGGEWPRAVARLDGIINLAGESIAAKRWTPRQKARIRDSRVETTRRLVDVLAASSSRPSVLVSASATGY